jgi:hypothetical protein
VNVQPWSPDFFAMRALAVEQAIHLNRTADYRQQRHASLFDYPMVKPDPQELATVRQAHARAKALGLTLPPYPKTTVRFVRAEDAAQGGETRSRDGVIAMAFVAGLRPLDGLRRLALHELRHVHQHATNEIDWLSLEECEHDAEAFAWNAMQGWRP